MHNSCLILKQTTQNFLYLNRNQRHYTNGMNLLGPIPIYLIEIKLDRFDIFKFCGNVCTVKIRSK